jgi:hypothetical protein
VSIHSSFLDASPPCSWGDWGHSWEEITSYTTMLSSGHPSHRSIRCYLLAIPHTGREQTIASGVRSSFSAAPSATAIGAHGMAPISFCYPQRSFGLVIVMEENAM